MGAGLSYIVVFMLAEYHTCSWIRLRSRRKMTGSPLGYWSASIPGGILDFYTIPERGGVQGTDRAVTTCRLPHYRGVPSYSPILVYPSTMLVYRRNTQIPPGLRPYGSTSKNLGGLASPTNLHPKHSSWSKHERYMNDEAFWIKD